MKFRNSKTVAEPQQEVSAEDSEEEYRRKRAAMAGPKKKVDEKENHPVKVTDH